MSNEEHYKQWRVTFPYSDEEIATAIEKDAEIAECDNRAERGAYLRQIAARARQGRISRAMISQTIGLLIKTCAICGKKALYRQGTSGRCWEHRFILNKFREERIARIEAAHRAHETSADAFEARDRQHRLAQRTTKFGKP